MKNKFQVEGTISYEDMVSQISLSHQLTCFKTRILCHSANLKCLTLRFFRVADNKSETRFSKFKIAKRIWPSLHLENVSIFLQLCQVTENHYARVFLRRL